MKIVDHIYKKDNNHWRAICSCSHGKEWNEGSNFLPKGNACKKCVEHCLRYPKDRVQLCDI